MGHTWEVHQAFYREYSSVIERLDVAKVLLMQDTDQVAENRKKKISEIDVRKLRDTTFSGESWSLFFSAIACFVVISDIYCVMQMITMQVTHYMVATCFYDYHASILSTSFSLSTYCR